MPKLPVIKFKKIGHRILAVSGVCVAAVVITFGQVSALRQEQSLREMSERDMQRLLDSVVRSIETIMLPGQAALVLSYADRLRTIPDLVDFRIMRVDGNEAFRDNRTIDVVNAKLGSALFARRERESVVPVLPASDENLEAAMRADGQKLVSYEEIPEGKARLVSFMYAIPNQRNCQGCHGTGIAFVGAMKLTVSMESVDAMLAAARRSTWIATGAALALAMLLIGAMIRRSVVRPIETVTAAMQRVAGGNLDESVPVTGEDELGQMARSFNAMTECLGELYRGLRLEQDKLHTVIQSTGEGVVVTDATGQVVLVNDAAVQLLGKRRERIIAEGFQKLLDNPEIVDALLQRQTNPVPSPYKVSYKGRALRVIAATIYGKEGTTIGSAALLRDITPVGEGKGYFEQSDLRPVQLLQG